MPTGWGYTVAVDLELATMHSSALPSYLSFLTQLHIADLYFTITSKTGLYYIKGQPINLLGSTLQLSGAILLSDPQMSSVVTHIGSNATSQVSAVSTNDPISGPYLLMQASLSQSDMMLLIGIEGNLRISPLSM